MRCQSKAASFKCATSMMGFDWLVFYMCIDAQARVAYPRHQEAAFGSSVLWMKLRNGPLVTYVVDCCLCMCQLNEKERHFELKYYS